MSQENRLAVVLGLNVIMVAALIAVGLSAHSLGVLAEGGDYVLDAAAVGVALLAMWLTSRPGAATSRAARLAPGVAALVNAGWLLVLEVVVAATAVFRLAGGTPEVHGLPVLVVSGAAAALMTLGAVVLGGGTDGDEHELSISAVLLDTVADAAAAAGVAVVGAVIMLTHGWFWLDPAVALVIALVVAYHAIALVRRVIDDLRAAGTMADVSDVVAKLQLRPGQKVFVANKPASVELDLPDQASSSADADAVIAFVVRSDDIPKHAAAAIEAAKADRLAWVAYPKAGKLGTDLSRDSLAAAMIERGAQPVRQVAIDDTWSALRFRPAENYPQRNR